MDKSADQPLYVDTRGAAKIIGFTPAALRKWRNEKPPRGPKATYVGKGPKPRVRYLVADVHAWAESEAAK